MVQTLSAYLPPDRLYALAGDTSLPDRARGAVLFADISGFTSLTDALARELGPQRGAEELTRQLNRVYGALIENVERFSGSVIGFSGDAITCWFDDQRFEFAAIGSHSHGLAAAKSHSAVHSEVLDVQSAAALRAVACALDMQQVMRSVGTLTTPAGATIVMGIKIAIAAGTCRRFLVGHPRIQKLEVLAGGILDRVAAAEQQARSGEIVVEHDLADQLGNSIQIQGWRGDATQRVAIVNGVSVAVPASPWPDVPELSPDITRDWLLPPVFQRLTRGEEHFLAEFRSAVAVFVSFTGIDYDQDDAALTKLDSYIRWVQTVLARYEAYLLQLTMGDKGSYIYMAFGAPLAHEDDPSRAAAAAWSLLTPPSDLPYIRDTKIGISQGLMHAGAYGAPTRRTYGVLGNQVNVAARLMTLAQPGQILITERIAEVLPTSYQIDNLGLLRLKGYSLPLTVLALRERRFEETKARTHEHSALAIVGRTTERLELSRLLQALLDGQSGYVLIEGEAGIGKSRLVEELIAQAQSLGIPTLLGAAEAIEQATPYFAWRPIFRTLFGLGEEVEPTAIQEHILAQLPENAATRERLPLLHVVLPLNIADNDLTRQMIGEVRIRNTQDVLIDILAGAPRATSALLLILEDAHWLDSASWALLARVQRELSNLLIAVASRPLDLGEGSSTPEEYRRLRADPATQHIQLTSLPPDETLDLVRARLGVRALPEVVGSFILRRAEGHPFFSEELAYALRETGLIRIDAGECIVATEAGDLAQIDFPQTIQGVITSRIDRLPLAHQLTLKVASVIGRIFAYRLLHSIHPIEADKPQLHDYLDALNRLDITPVEVPEPQLAYVFKHIITQEVAYQLLVFAQRRQLHAAVAAWYERAYYDDIESFYPLIAHHWTKAEVADKAIDYLEKAGQQAAKQYALQETLFFFGEALRLDAQERATVPSDQSYPADPDKVSAEQLRRARWLRAYGLASVNLGRLTESQPYLEEALRLLGDPLPSTPGRMRGRLLRELGKQIRHRLRPPKGRTEKGHVDAVRFEAAWALTVLGNVYAVTNELDKAAYTLLTGFNILEPLGPSHDLALSTTGMAYVSKLLSLPAMAKRYTEMALKTAEQVNRLPTTTIVLSRVGIYYAISAQWKRAESVVRESIAIAERLRDRYQWQESSAVLNTFHFYLGRFRECIALGAEIEKVTQQEGNALIRGWALADQARSLLRLGQCADAIVLAERTHASVAEGKLVDPGTSMTAYGVLGCAYCQQDDFIRARQVIEQGLVLLREHAMVVVGGTGATTIVAESCLALFEAGQPNADWAQRAADEATRLLFKRVRTEQISRPGAWVCRGRYFALAGQQRKARQHLLKGLRYAEQYDMPYEQGVAHYELARLLNLDAVAERAKHLANARAIFERIEASFHLARVRALIDDVNN